MKVICIEKIDTTERGMENAPRPDVGDEDIVIMTWKRYAIVYYSLERFGRGRAYMSTCFAVCDSNIDETTLVNEKETVNA